MLIYHAANYGHGGSLNVVQELRAYPVKGVVPRVLGILKGYPLYAFARRGTGNAEGFGFLGLVYVRCARRWHVVRLSLLIRLRLV